MNTTTTLDEPALLDAIAESRRLHSDALERDAWQLARLYDNRVRAFEDALMHFRIARSRIDRLAGC